jgi:Fungal specific transcription factor domain
VNTGADLRKFCNSANIAFLTGSKIDGEIFQEILISVQYRLMTLKFSDDDDDDNDKEGKLNEALRLALLTFSNTVFLQLRGMKVRFSILSLQLKDALRSQVAWADLRRLKTVSLWILFIAAIAAVNDEDDVWLMPLINELLSETGSFISWHMVRSILKDFIWIDQLHDEDGKAVYSRAFLWNQSVPFR